MKPETSVKVQWTASSAANSGTLSGYKVRYTTNGGQSYTVVHSSLGSSTTEYAFTPNIRDKQTLQVQVCAYNSYGKESSWTSFQGITVYSDGDLIGKLGGAMKYIRGYVKVGNETKKLKYIKVKTNGIVYNIDQYPAPLS